MLDDDFGGAVSFDGGERGDHAVHFAIHGEVFNDFLAVAFESAVVVVEFDAVDFTEKGVEDAGGEDLVPRVVAFFFVAGDDVPAVTFVELGEEAGDFFGVVLEVGVEGEDYFSCCFGVSCGEGGCFGAVGPEAEGADVLGVFLGDLLNDVPRVVVTTVVDEDDFPAS